MATNEEMAKLMKPGVKVVRGDDFNYGDEDGKGSGTVIEKDSLLPGWCTVRWDNNGNTFSYRMGFQNKFELKILNDEEPKIEKPGKTLGSLMFNNKKFVDFKIKCGSKTFECHKNVLACHSDVFEAMFTNDDMTEAKSGEVEIDDIKPDAMGRSTLKF